MFINYLLILNLNIKKYIACKKGHEDHRPLNRICKLYTPENKGGGRKGGKNSYLPILKPSVHLTRFGCLSEEHMPGLHPLQFWVCRLGAGPGHL